MLREGLVHVAGLHFSTADHPVRNSENVGVRLGDSRQLIRLSVLCVAADARVTEFGDRIQDERDCVQTPAVCIQLMLLIWLNPALMRALLGLSRS